MLKINGLIALTTVSLFGLTACGGGGSSSSVVKKNGVFKDSNVSGLSYVSGGQDGVTDASGGFIYEDGEDVAFSIGAVALGSGTGKAVMTPVDLVANGTLASAEVINKVRFLMMLDKDNTPSNGIEISKKVQAKAESWAAVDFAAADFPTQNVNNIVTSASVADGIEHEIPEATVAATHLKTTLLCANAGAYVGSYEGTESGNIALVVNPVTGEVVGSSYNPENEVSVEISSATALDYDMGLEFVSAEDSAKEFTGKLNSTEDLSGTWENSANTSLKGTFSAERLGGESDAVYRYTVPFTGGDQGLFTFDVDKSNNVKGTTYSVSTNEESEITGKLVDNKLTAKSDDGTEIDGVLDEETLTLSGVWSNVTDLEAGSYVGGGCRLN
ncbi:hypothetical protein OO007_11615 [Cocleimonas sp. KMM 6892]|uniref:hypothetical protein n=1 Tax=unclassified Cocleimonas TaxID=2639732 RepID=UPI002DB86021|nr:MULTISPECIES: hypothetical protein [unclassified Cocleimonas]MEB8432879.1 hypothetical protein [Cocleimonas sp. KMM 6892]MEC4715738.1 hypothetical protein [Cocleimonas sp. KMM 6895]MEC4744644.1 hypothetical protein [Cocleimonas sp. KMM 6896]